MDPLELVQHISRQTHDWPDPNWNDRASRMAGNSELRVCKVIGESPILWATGKVEEPAGGPIRLELTAITRASIIVDSAESAPGEPELSRGKTRVISWSALTEVTLIDYRPSGTTATQTESADFSLHFDGLVVGVSSRKFEGRADGIDLLEYALAKLAAAE